ncbi:MAG: prepilin-type N-terminal cleavage/methylation domain-containing protein [Thermodesulfobacteriota bacterium]
MDQKTKPDHPAFTLIEIIIVVAVMSALLAIAAPMIAVYIQQTRAKTCLSLRYQIEKAETVYVQEKNAPSEGFAELVGNGLLSQLPVCPSKGVYGWLQRTPQPILGCSHHYTTVPEGGGGHVLLTSSFDNMNNLTSLKGTWRINNGSLANNPGVESRIAFGDSTWANYEIKVSATLLQGNGYGVYYRASGKPNITGYVFQYDPGLGNKFVIRKVYNGSEQAPFQSVSMPAGFPIYNTNHDISITVAGNHHAIKVDNQVVITFQDDSFAAGSGGFRTWGQSAATFDHLTVVRQ